MAALNTLRLRAVLTKRSMNSGSLIGIIVIIAVILIAVVGFALLRRFRQRRNNQNRNHAKSLSSSTTSPTSSHPPDNIRSRLSTILAIPSGRNANTRPSSSRSSMRPPSENEETSMNNHDLEMGQAPSQGNSRLASHSQRNSIRRSHADPENRQSVRSIATLPAYNMDANDDETVLGREGERAGIDTVVEYPETQDQIEARREDEMDSLYQIRLARRAEIAAREERRRVRAEARQRGDYATLATLRQESRLRADANRLAGDAGVEGSAQRMIREHQAATRERGRSTRVSEVDYGNLGVARHDGSRIRARSNSSAASDSERGLLSGAASMGGSHNRQFSNTSTASLDTTHSNGSTIVGNDLSRTTTAHSAQSHLRGAPSIDTSFTHDEHDPLTQVLTNTTTRSRASSHATQPTVETVPETTGDVGDEPIPSVQPPSYEGDDWENAPEYSSPRASRLWDLWPGVGRRPTSIAGLLNVDSTTASRVPEIEVTASSPMLERAPESQLGRH